MPADKAPEDERSYSILGFAIGLVVVAAAAGNVSWQKLYRRCHNSYLGHRDFRLI
jgi:hypothetical protein